MADVAQADDLPGTVEHLGIAWITLRTLLATRAGSTRAAGGTIGPRGSLRADELREIHRRLLLLARVAHDHDAGLLDAHGGIRTARDERERGRSDGDGTNTVHFRSSLTWRRAAGRREETISLPGSIAFCALPAG